MKINIEKKVPHSPIHMIWGIIAILLIAGARMFSDFIPDLPPCLFRRLTGIPCLTCGGTHCIQALSQVNLVSAFQFNPLIMLGILIMIVFSLSVVGGFVIKRRFRVELSTSELWGLRIGLIIIVCLNWIYLIVRMT